MKKQPSFLTVYGFILLIILLLSMASCGYNLQQRVNAQNGGQYVHFQYIDRSHIKVISIERVWLSNGTDTILLHPLESVLLKSDPLNLIVWSGDRKFFFTF